MATLRGTVRDTWAGSVQAQPRRLPSSARWRPVCKTRAFWTLVLRVDTNTLLYQVPGGMLSNLNSQLKQAGKEDKYYDQL